MRYHGAGLVGKKNLQPFDRFALATTPPSGERKSRGGHRKDMRECSRKQFEAANENQRLFFMDGVVNYYGGYNCLTDQQLQHSQAIKRLTENQWGFA
jgi:hypothetical protein